jgi:hypothetical protein
MTQDSKSTVIRSRLWLSRQEWWVSSTQPTLLAAALDDMWGAGASKNYALACFMGASVVMARGITQTLVALGRAKEVGPNSQNVNDFTQLNIHNFATVPSDENDWVPGDWGYIENTTKGSIKNGLTIGQNIINIGQNLFWGHGVAQGNLQAMKVGAAHGGTSAVSSKRECPTIGLFIV